MGSTDVRLVKDILMEKVILGSECFVEKGARKPTRFMVNKHEKCGFSQLTMAEFHQCNKKFPYLHYYTHSFKQCTKMISSQ